MTSPYERRFRTLTANLNLIHGQLRGLIDDMWNEKYDLDPVETGMLSKLRDASMKLDRLTTELRQ